MKKTIQVLILVWFAIAALLVLGGGISLIAAAFQAKTPDVPAPCKINCPEAKTPEEAQNLYAAQAAAYEKQLAVMKAKADYERSPALETYKAVARETLQPLLNTILAALLAYVFVNATGTLINNQIAAKADAPLQRFELF